MKYKGIIFDLDGVICFTDQYHFQAWKKIADKIGVPFDENRNNKLRGISRMDSLNIILEVSDRAYSEKEKLQFACEKDEIYKKLLRKMTPDDLEKEIRDTLNILKGKGYKLAIGSSSKNAKLILERIGALGYFHAVSDGTNIKNSKPDPEVFLKAAQFLGLKPEECLVVEDAKAGIEAASAGGFDSAGIGEAAYHENVTYSLKHITDLKKI